MGSLRNHVTTKLTKAHHYDLARGKFDDHLSYVQTTYLAGPYGTNDELGDHVFAMEMAYLALADGLLIWDLMNDESKLLLCQHLRGMRMIEINKSQAADAAVIVNPESVEPGMPPLATVNFINIKTKLFPVPDTGVLHFFFTENVHPFVKGERFDVQSAEADMPVPGPDSSYYSAEDPELPGTLLEYIEYRIAAMRADEERSKLAHDYNNMGEYLQGLMRDDYDMEKSHPELVSWANEWTFSPQLFGMFSTQQSDPRSELFRELASYGDWGDGFVALGKELIEKGVYRDSDDWELRGVNWLARHLNTQKAPSCIPLFNISPDSDDCSLSFIISASDYAAGKLDNIHCISQST